MWASLARALDAEIGRATAPRADGGAPPPTREARTTVRDLFGLVRATVLRCQLARLLGSAVLAAAGDAAFIEAFMAFQDAIEEATAKAAVLPRCLALPLALWPVARTRRQLTARLAAAIEVTMRTATADDALGSWLLCSTRSADRPIEAVAELAIGLLFASHKNPAIGAAQTVCKLMQMAPENPTTVETVRAEVARMSDAPSAERLSGCHTLQRCVLETLRIYAHAIGAVRTVANADGFILGGRFWAARGETIALAHVAVHRTPAVWGEQCEAFVTTRSQYGPAGAAAAPPDPYTYTTFSQGMHKCPGERLALRTIECLVAQLVARGIALAAPLPAVSFERATLAQRKGPVAVTLAVGG